MRSRSAQRGGSVRKEAAIAKGRLERKSASGTAPGRLDFLGGVADYSGSLVLEMPLSLTTRVRVSERAGSHLDFVSAQEGCCTLPEKAAPEEAPHWVRYIYGCYLLFRRDQGWTPRSGLVFKVTSRVPASMGVGSSAALEVATMRALESLSGRRFTGTALARLAQRVENEIVGAPCGLMDQLASAYGPPGSLLPILCRPDILEEPVGFPRGIIAAGWPSEVRHAVTASPYKTARAAAFMGRKLVERATGRRLPFASDLTPPELRSLPLELLPSAMTGRAFLKRCGGVEDPLSRVDPSGTYPVRAGLTFPVEENWRTRTVLGLLRAMGKRADEEGLRMIGELMFQSHAGYSAMGLGCVETDAMVEAIRILGPERGFYGARISGGGSGGTVAVLMQASAIPALRRLSGRVRFTGETPPLLR